MNEVSIEKILDDFMSESGTLGDEQFYVHFRRDGAYAYRSFAYGTAHAGFNMLGRHVDEYSWVFVGFELYLASG